MTLHEATGKANRKAERFPGTEFVVIKRTAHPATPGGLAHIVARASEIHALSPDASIVHRIRFNGVEGDGLASYTLAPGLGGLS